MTNSLSFYNFLCNFFGNRFLSCWLLGFFRWSNFFSLSWWFLSCSFLSNNFLDNFLSYRFPFNFFLWFWFIAKYAYVMMYLLVYWNKLKEPELRLEPSKVDSPKKAPKPESKKYVAIRLPRRLKSLIYSSFIHSSFIYKGPF